MRISDWSSDVCSSDLHGLRRGEIAQLAPQDVKEIEKVWVMRVRGERLKTINAHRTIPVHPELQRLGVLRFVEQQRQAGTGFRFPLQEPNKREQRSEQHPSALQSLMSNPHAVC